MLKFFGSFNPRLIFAFEKVALDARSINSKRIKFSFFVAIWNLFEF